jgi:hypothetical protein
LAGLTCAGTAGRVENAQVAVHLVYASDTGRLVTGDEVYGASAGLRSQLEAPGVGYVLAVVCHRHVRFGGTTIGSTSYAGRFRPR